MRADRYKYRNIFDQAIILKSVSGDGRSTIHTQRNNLARKKM